MLRENGRDLTRCTGKDANSITRWSSYIFLSPSLSGSPRVCVTTKSLPHYHSQGKKRGFICMRYTLDEAIQSEKKTNKTNKRSATYVKWSIWKPCKLRAMKQRPDNPYYLMTIFVFALIASCQRRPSGNIWIAYTHREQLLNRIDVLYPLY